MSIGQTGCDKVMSENQAVSAPSATSIVLAPGDLSSGLGMSAADFLRLNPDVKSASRPFSLPSGVASFDEIVSVVLLDDAGTEIIKIQKLRPIGATLFFVKAGNSDEAHFDNARLWMLSPQAPKDEALTEYRRVLEALLASKKCEQLTENSLSEDPRPYPSEVFPVRSRLLCGRAYEVSLSVYGGHPSNLKTHTFDFQFHIAPAKQGTTAARSVE